MIPISRKNTSKIAKQIKYMELLKNKNLTVVKYANLLKQEVRSLNKKLIAKEIYKKQENFTTIINIRILLEICLNFKKT